MRRAKQDRFLYDQILDSVFFLEKDYDYKVNKVNLWNEEVMKDTM